MRSEASVRLSKSLKDKHCGAEIPCGRPFVKTSGWFLGGTSQLSGITVDFSGDCDGFCDGFLRHRDGFCDGFCGSSFVLCFPKEKDGFRDGF